MSQNPIDIQETARQSVQKLQQKYGDLLKAYTSREEIEIPEHLKHGPAAYRDLYIQQMQLEMDCEKFLESQQKRNICTFSEYRDKWLFLHRSFKHSGCETEEEYIQKRAELSNEYVQRFAVTYPVIIVDDADHNKVLCEIEPVMRTPNPITGERGHRYASSFSAAVSLPGTEMRPDIMDEATSKLVYSIGASNPDFLFKPDKNKEEEANLKALDVIAVFCPDHPYLKEHRENIQNNLNATATTTTEESSKESKTSEGVELKLSDDDLF